MVEAAIQVVQETEPSAELTRKRVCAACAKEEERGRASTAREPPRRIERKRGRRPEIDTSGHFCPGEDCEYYGWLDRGNISGVWQMFTGHFGNGLWIAFIGWFLETAAASEIQQQTLQEALAGHHVADAMRRNSTVVKPGNTLEQLVDEHILGAGRRSLIVAQNGNVVGLLTLHDVKEIPRSDWPTTTSAQAMIPAERMKRIQPDAELGDALKEMARDGINQLPVMVGDQLQGVLGRDDVISMLRTIAVFSRQ